MQPLARDGFTAAEVTDALTRADRALKFRYQLLDSSNAHKAWLTGVSAGSVAHNNLADIKRTARFTIRDGEDSINFLSDRIKPWVYARVTGGAFPSPMTSSTVAGWAGFPQGVFLLTSPTKATGSSADVVVREVDAYDQTIVLRDDKVTDRYTVAAATNYITAVKAVLDGAGVTAQNLTATSSTLPVARDWAPGTPKLTIVNDLLAAINYRSLHFDADGRATARPYLSPATAAPEWTYADDEISVLSPVMALTLDLFEVPNEWVLVVSEPDRTVLTSTYTNENEQSPTSTVNRDRTIVDFRTDTDAVDQSTLDAKVERLAFEASQVYESIDIQTAIMPFHDDADVLELAYSPLEIDDKFSEHTWGFEFRAGSWMTHRVRRVVEI